MTSGRVLRNLRFGHDVGLLPAHRLEGQIKVEHAPHDASKGAGRVHHQARGDIAERRLDRTHALRVLPIPVARVFRQKTRCAPLGKAVHRRMAGRTDHLAGGTVAATARSEMSRGSAREIWAAVRNSESVTPSAWCLATADFILSTMPGSSVMKRLACVAHRNIS